MDKPQNIPLVIIVLIGFLMIFANFSVKQGIDRIGDDYVDFPTFYFAPKIVLEDGYSPYPPGQWNQAENLAGYELWPYVYPPPSLLLFAPLNLFSYETARLVILAINHILILSFAYLLFHKVLGIRNILHWLIGLSYLYLFYPVVATIFHGQINLIVLVLILLFWYALKQDLHPALAALPLVLGIMLKVYPLLFLPYLLLKRKFAVFLWNLLGLVLMIVTSVIVLPSELWRDWGQNILSSGYGDRVLQVLMPGSTTNQSINGFTSRLFIGLNVRIDVLIYNPEAAVIVPYVLSGLVLLITFSLIMVMSREKERVSEYRKEIMDWEISFLLVAMYLVAPFSWDHHLVFLLPAIFVAFFHFLGTRPKYFWLAPLVITSIMLAVKYPFHNPDFHIGRATLLISAKFYAVVLLWGLYCIYPVIKLYINRSAVAGRENL